MNTSNKTAEPFVEEQDIYSDSSESFEEAKIPEALDPSRQAQIDPVTIVKLIDILNLIQAKCDYVNEILDTQDDESLIILNYYGWNKDLIGEDWLEKQDKLRKEIGLEPKHIIELEDLADKVKCPGCLVSKSKKDFDSLKCNHILCKDCWADYIQYNVTHYDKPFFWRCLIDGCNIIIPDSFNQKYLIDETKPQYQKKMAIAYTNASKSFRWCPTVDCYYGVEVADTFAQPIQCRCGQVYCFKCGQEDHRPCTCDVAEDWIKGSNKGEIVGFTKHSSLSSRT